MAHRLSFPRRRESSTGIGFADMFDNCQYNSVLSMSSSKDLNMLDSHLRGNDRTNIAVYPGTLSLFSCLKTFQAKHTLFEGGSYETPLHN
jgi:hypothetical protein